jgi:hypothetical protein
MTGSLRRAILVALVLGMSACDSEAEAEANAPTEAEANAMVKKASGDALDLKAIIADVESGEIETAADLEARLTAKDAPKIDADTDGTPDHLHVVERRTSSSTTFEIRATAADDPATELEDATLVAVIELEPAPEDGVVEVTAAYAPTYAASASVDVEATTVRHRTHGIVVHADGGFEVTAEAGVFVAWAFRPGRPVFVATVFIVHDHHHYDGCWPPGHCKHGKWKAHGGGPPGHAKPHRHSGRHGFKHKGHKRHKSHRGHKGGGFKGKHKGKGR